jgi:hypothetical protein
MNIIQKRFLGFFICISARSYLSYLAKYIDKRRLRWLGFIALLPAFGFFAIYIGKYRKTGQETFGQKIWWNNLRPLHSILYFIFAYLAINKNTLAYIPLVFDVIIGIIAFFHYHYIVKSFTKLF